MFLKNNKGFSMLEILVSVGIVSLLIGVAAPAYNQYKKSSTRVALKSDLSNVVKAYNAYNAVNASYCASLGSVGFAADDTGSLYQKQAFTGFEGVSGNCTFANMVLEAGVTTRDKTQMQVRTSDETAGTCSDTTYTTKTACEGATETWTADPNMAFTGTPTACVLQEGEFLAGATTGVSALGTWYTMDEDGRTDETALGDANDPNSGDCTDPA